MIKQKSTPKSNRVKDNQKDLDEIRREADENASVNWTFRSMIKASDISSQSIDTTAHEIYKRIVTKIDCTECGNCCAQITPVLTKTDKVRIARHLKMSIDSFEKNFVSTHNNLDVFKQKPCVFLKSKKCTIYAVRPHDCKSYPHLDKKHIRSRLTTLYSHIGICPIIFNFYNKMRAALEPSLDPDKITWL